MLAKQEHNIQNLSSSIQTILLVLESHQILTWTPAKSCVFTLADYTANREFHPALKIQLFNYQINYRFLLIVFSIQSVYFGNFSEVALCTSIIFRFTTFHNVLTRSKKYAVLHDALGQQGLHLNNQSLKY